MEEKSNLLNNRYELKNKLGRGGSSQIYFAYDREKRKNRAVKILDKLQNGQMYYIVKKEAELIRKLRYPYFPEVEEIIETENTCYIVMEYLEGETLDKILERQVRVSRDEVIKWAKDLCLMLGFLHHCSPPVIYCDMKPANIMLQSGGNLRLLDFGAAWEWEEGKTQILSLGTRGYAAPEQLDGSGIVDERTDIYCLGMTMYHLLTGEDPCELSRRKYMLLRHKRHLLYGKLEKVIRKCIEQDPVRRYQSCEELFNELP